MKFRFGIAQELPTSLKFMNDRVQGIISPRIHFYVGDVFSFSLAFTATVDLSIDFTIRDLKTIVKAHINDINMKDWLFTAGTVQNIDLIQLAETWNPFLLPVLVNQVNGVIGSQGIEFGVITALKDIFNIDIQTMYFKLNEGYLEGSLNLDIYKTTSLFKFPFRQNGIAY